MDGNADDSLDTAGMDGIERRILEATIELAAEGGYDAVRQREVACRAGVALATLYARFDGKHALLAAALELEGMRCLRELEGLSLRARTPLARVTKLFAELTEVFLRRPELARAALRAAASGEQTPTMRLMVTQQRITARVADALRGPPKAPDLDDDAALRVATVLVMVWFASLTGWAGGVASGPIVVDVVHHTADMLLHGVEGAGPA